MRQGDFTNLAKEYINRPSYSMTVLGVLGKYTGTHQEGFKVADVGAGTGKLTENLIALGCDGYCVEPNEAMRQEGIDRNSRPDLFRWFAGSAESTGLKSKSVDWVLMASSFHWTKPELALPEFHRVLKPGGFLTVLWNPRDIESSPLHKRIEDKVHSIVPKLKRVSSGSKAYTDNIEETLVSTGHFCDVVFIESPHTVTMSKERYLGAWRSVNDIQAQAGPLVFKQVLKSIEDEIRELNEIVVPYRTRSWTVRVR